MITRDQLDELTRQYTDQGCLIEVGWIALRRTFLLSHDVPDDQLQMLRIIFFSGAQHLFASIIGLLDAADDATDADLRRMDLIAGELKEFAEEFAQTIQTGGTA